MAAAALFVAAAPHRRLAGRPRHHAVRPPLRPSDPEPFSALWRAGLCDDGPGAQPQGPTAAGRLAGGLSAARPAVHARALRCLYAARWSPGRPVAQPWADLLVVRLAGGAARGGGPHAPAHGATAVCLCR